MNQASPQRRRTFLLDKKIQGTLGKRIVFHWLLFFGLTLMLNIALRVVGNVDHLPLADVLQNVAREQATSTLVILALLPWFINDTLKLSHRFVGPIQRIRSAVKQLTSGDDVQPIVLRKGDFFVDFANEFNTLRTKTLHDREELALAKQRLAALTAGIGQPSSGGDRCESAAEQEGIAAVPSCIRDTVIIEPGMLPVFDGTGAIQH